LSPSCSVFWVPAIDIASFEQAYHEIGVKLGVPGIDDDKANIKLLVQRGLSEMTSSWLMIIDNADDINMLYAETSRLVDYLPFNHNSSILLTTRNFEIATRFSETDVITIEEMSENEAQDLLERSLGTEVQVDERDNMRRLLQLLTNLPLAIKQAAAFMKGKKKSISTYLRVYLSSDMELIQNLTLDFEDQGRYKGYKKIRNPIAATWLITFEAISKSGLAHKYLCFMFCVAAKDIPHSLLPPASDREQEDVTALLEQYAFITPRNRGTSYDMHRLVHLAGQNWLKSQETWTLWSTKSLSQVAEVFPYCEHKERALCLQYLPHAQIILNKEFPEGFDQSRWILFLNVGRIFSEINKYRDAEIQYLQALQLVEKALGSDHTSTLITVGNLGLLYSDQGKLVEAEQMYQRALQGFEKALGPDHISTLDIVNNLGIL
jgi:tetratricopeptide (TPR) repeat protein